MLKNHSNCHCERSAAISHSEIASPSLAMTALAVCIFFFIPLLTHAFTISPGLIDASVNPGGIYRGSITLTNDEGSVQTYYLAIQKFIPKGDNGQQEFLPLSDTRGLPSWTFFEQPSVALKAGEERAIPFSVRVPNEALPGGYYAAVFFSTRPPLETAQGAVITGSRTGILLLLTVNGGLVEKLRVIDVAREMPQTVSHLPAVFRLMLENEGNVHVIPQGEIRIKNMFGMRAATLPINPASGRVLPGSSRRLIISWQKEEPHSVSGFWQEAREEWRNFGFGSYTATFHFFGPQMTSSEPISLSFSVWPWRLGLIFLGGLVIMMILLRLYGRAAVHRATLKK
ncbi:hypothetical protein EXS71_02355 [Candidatus Uhrbacteria bacterium]|nr:hypothetical protein [Candidatus Uhrbacteria bacterium]